MAFLYCGEFVKNPNVLPEPADLFRHRSIFQLISSHCFDYVFQYFLRRQLYLKEQMVVSEKKLD